MKQTHHNEPIHDTATSVVHEAIAARAHEIWVRDGQRENNSEANWLEAERELVTGRRPPRSKPASQPVLF